MSTALMQSSGAPTNLSFMLDRTLTDIEIHTYVCTYVHDVSMMSMLNNCVCLYSLAVFTWTVAQQCSATGLMLSEYSVHEWDHMR